MVLYNHHFLKESYKEKTNEIIEGKRILDICENKLENFTFMDNVDFSCKGLRKFLLISRTMYLTSWKINVLASERVGLKEREDEFEDESEDESEENEDIEDILIPSIFNDINEYTTIERISEVPDDLSKIMSDDELLDDEFLDDDDNEDTNLNTTDSYRALNRVSQEGCIFTNSVYGDNDDDDSFQECYGYDDKENTFEEEVDSLRVKDLRFIDHNNEGAPSVVVSVTSKNHEIPVPSQLSKHGLNFDEEIVSDCRVTYKKIKYI